MKTIIVTAILFILTVPAYADSLFFQPFDTIDWSLLAGTALADIGDMSTSSDIPNYASNGHPGFHEINPAIDLLWNTNTPSQMQYAVTFVGIAVLQTAIAYALPEKYSIRKIALASFITIGTVDTVRNISMGLKFAW